jgi:hypothetical protein
LFCGGYSGGQLIWNWTKLIAPVAVVFVSVVRLMVPDKVPYFFIAETLCFVRETHILNSEQFVFDIVTVN